jgi:hypothetical protein
MQRVKDTTVVGRITRKKLRTTIEGCGVSEGEPSEDLLAPDLDYATVPDS